MTFIKRDGIVVEWYRWVALCIAILMVFVYAIFNAILIAVELRHNLPFRIQIDLSLLVYIVPAGILLGEMGYTADLKANGTKRIDLEK